MTACACGCGQAVSPTKWTPNKRYVKGHSGATAEYARQSLPSADKHWKWAGDNVSYNGLHRWLRKNHPKTGICAHCGEASRTDWANISGRYERDIADYTELCRFCHHKFDN